MLRELESKAAIVCRHIAKDDLPILFAVRGKTVRTEDSGWQFLCDSGVKENPDEAKVWTLGEVLERDMSLGEFMDLPVGTVLIKANRNAKWEMRVEHDS